MLMLTKAFGKPRFTLSIQQVSVRQLAAGETAENQLREDLSPCEDDSGI